MELRSVRPGYLPKISSEPSRPCIMMSEASATWGLRRQNDRLTPLEHDLHHKRCMSMLLTVESLSKAKITTKRTTIFHPEGDW